jgi:putative endonuclease
MHYVYLIYSPNKNSFYYGYTNNIKRRIKEHNFGKCYSTCKTTDWEVIYCEIYLSGKDATNREKQLKQFGAAYGHLKKRCQFSIAAAKSAG